jgi:hypothetical protein
MNAWIELSASEYKDVWDRFYNSFEFRPSITAAGWPGIREPRPSVTYSIADADGIVDGLDARALAVFRSLVVPDTRIYALDWQHTCFWFYPHLAGHEPFRISVFPDGDYSIFLAEDFSFGLFGHPWQETVCAFGERLLQVMAHHEPLFTHVLRRDGLRPTHKGA